jgi:hypothetical protein
MSHDKPRSRSGQSTRTSHPVRRALLIGVPLVGVIAGALWFERGRGPGAWGGRGGVDATRSNTPARGADERPGPLTFLVGAVAEIDVPTAAATKDGVAAAAYWVRDNEARAWNATITSAEGSVHLRGPIEAPWGGVEDDLAIVVGPAGTTAPTPAECRPPCQIVWRQVRYVRSIVPSAVPSAAPSGVPAPQPTPPR